MGRLVSHKNLTTFRPFLRNRRAMMAPPAPIRTLLLGTLLLPSCLLLLPLRLCTAFVPLGPGQHSLQASPSAASTPAAAKVYNDEYPWRERWWPVAFDKVTDRNRPHAFELLGTPISFYFNHVANQWQAVLDTCPHRLAPLSEGRIDESGCIECPYHGELLI